MALLNLAVDFRSRRSAFRGQEGKRSQFLYELNSFTAMEYRVGDASGFIYLTIEIKEDNEENDQSNHEDRTKTRAIHNINLRVEHNMHH